MDQQERQVWAQEILARFHRPVQCECGRPWPCTIREGLEMIALGLEPDPAHTPMLVN